MKILIAPDNWVEINTDGANDAEQALLLIRRLLCSNTPADASAEFEVLPIRTNPTIGVWGKHKSRSKPPVTLTPALAESWEWLVRNDVAAGQSPKVMSDATGLTRVNAQFRVEQLVKRGAATRVSRGRYRAVL